ncbi:heterokaryon incompatibility protein-domain-containing protein, partial [Hyaloscypha finlandica]
SAGQTENSPPRLPKRVIDIRNFENERTVRLLETGTNWSGRYICLSHCWGGSLHFRTTTETVEERMRSINIDDLPLNFQDTIDLTRRLGVQYLWIDALCIIQDSKDDWEAEAAKMGVYYKNSWLTVAAGMFKDGSRGLFAERHIPEQPMCRLQVAGTEEMDLSNSCDSLTMHKLRPSSNEHLVKSIPPIRTRAWALQEELLPDRYVIFEPSQVYFRCDGFVDFETGRREVLDASSAFSGGKLCFKSADWQTVVRRYSARDLTQEMDKLPALSGLAHEYRDTWSGDYLAGLWRKDLWQGLLWKRRALASSCNFRRPKTYRAPSWSWASTEGEIDFSNTSTTNQECRIDILHASTQLAGLDPMGQVSRGQIVLRGILMDSKEMITQSHHILGMVSLSFTYSGLILSRVSGQSRTYERVGHFETRLGFSPDEFWKFPRENELISII